MRHHQHDFSSTNLSAAWRCSRLARSAIMAGLISIAAGLIVLIFLPGTDVIRAQGGGVVVRPGQGVEFQQVSFLFSATAGPNSDWGRLSADPVQLSTATGLSSGYLNLFTNAGWVVQNLPVNLSDGQTPVTTYFRLGLSLPTPIGQLSAHLVFTPEPQLSFADGPRSLFPVGQVLWNAEGAGDARTTAIGPAPPSNLVTFIPGGVTTKHTQPGAVNVQTAKNQCFPMSIANSLQYLENRFGIRVPHEHTPGLRGDNSLVGQLDAQADRNAPARNAGSGVWFQPMLRGKFAYLERNGLKEALIHKHQGRGYGDPTLGQALPDGNFTSSGITSRDDGASVTWEWICQEIKRGQDVELVFSYDNALGQPTGGHAVRVFECGMTLGIPWIGYLHDRQQSDIDPLDNQGLEMVRAFTVDMDGDGMLNLGAENREIRFALSESPVEVDQFPNSLAQITLMSPLGTETVTLRGPTTVHVFIGPEGQAGDADGDGRDQVGTEIVRLELTGTSSVFGPLVVRLRDVGQHPFQRSTGEIEETTNAQSGRLDLPPFAPAGTALSFFDVFVEIELQNPPPNVPPQLRRLHNDRPKRMQTTITHKPPARGETYESPEIIELLDENDNPTGIQLGATFHTPNPLPPVCSLTPPTTTNIVNTAHTVTVTVTQGNNPVAGVSVNFTVSGANPTAGVATTDGNGQAVFSYTGTNTGSDTITASGSVQGLAFSCTAQKTWIPCIATCNVTPSVLDFGQVCPGQSTDRTLVLNNTGNVPLTLTSITSTNPAFTVISPLPATILPGGSLNLIVRFTCTTPGRESGTLSFSASSLCGPVNCGTVTVSGTCLQYLCDLAPRSLNFGQVCPGQFADQVLTLRNLGNALFTLTTITSSNPAFSIVSPALPLNLNPGESVPVTIRFVCQGPGAQSGTLSFSASSFCGPIECGTVTVSGACLQFACDVSPRTIDFGALCVGQSADRALTVRNLGNQPFVLNAVTSSNPAFTVVSPALPLTVPAGGNVPVTVRFTSTTPGQQTGTLSFNAGGFCGPVDCGPVTLSGFGAQVCCTVSPRTIDFGTLCVGQSANRTFTVSNCGNVSFTLNAISPTNPAFTVVSPALPLTVPAGGSVTVTIRYTSTSPGQQSGTLNFSTSSFCGPVDCGPVTLSGFGAQVCCTVSPRTIDFGTLCVGQSADRTFTVSNCGTVSFTLNAVNSSNQAFTVVSPALPVTVPAGGSVTVTVRFTCTTLGQQSGTLSFNTSSVCGPADCGIVSLTGFCAQVCCTISPRTLDFGQGCQNESATRTFTVSNCGSVSFTLNTISSSNSAFRVVSPALPVTVPAGGSVTVTVRFTCTTLGQQSGTLSFNTSSVCGPVECGTVNLTGFCQQAVCNVSPTTLDFGSVPQGQNQDRTFVVSNTGNVAFTLTSITSSNPAFSVVSPAPPVTVPAGGSITVTVRLGCTSSGSQTGTLNFTTTSVCGPVSCSTVTVRGTCLAPPANLSLMKTDSPDPVTVGSDLTYTLIVTNNGPGTATNVRVTDTLPANVTFVSSSSSQGTCSRSGNTVTCNLGTLANGASATIMIVVTPRVVGTITNRASVAGNEIDNETSDNTASAMTTVQAAPVPDIDVQPPSANFGTVQVGSTSSQDFTVGNTGTAVLNVSATSVVGPDASQFAITGGGGAFSLSPGETRTVTVQFAPTSGGNKTATLRFVSNDPDENPKDVPLSGRGRSGVGGQMALIAADDVTVVGGLPGSGQVLTTIQVPGNAREVAVAPNRQFALALTDASQVTVISNLSGSSQTRSVNVGGNPVGVAISQDSSFAVVLVATRPVRLVRISGLPDSPTVEPPFVLSEVQSGAQDIALSQFGTVVASVAGHIAIVDGFQSGGTPMLRGLLRVGSDPSGVAFTSDGSAAFFVSPAITAVFVITRLLPGQSPRLERPIFAGARPNPRAIRLSPDGSMAVVTNQGDNSVSIFEVSGATLTPVGQVTVGNLPAGVSISTDGDTALVANATDETVFVITGLRSSPAVTAILGPGTQFRTLADREQSVAFVP